MILRYKSIFLATLAIILFTALFYSPGTSLAASNKTVPILSTAKSLIGSPYRSGGISPNGFDCSGFVNYVYKKHGISISRSSVSLWSSGGEKVSSLEPGDLLFFNTNGRTVSHVAIYIGDGQFIHSASYGGVKIDSLSAAYYKKTYLGAKRFI
ncbi:MAG: C40 family peptidase [Bacillota bacterium]|nr:C40 family peptidase [Bacillota bacterium]